MIFPPSLNLSVSLTLLLSGFSSVPYFCLSLSSMYSSVLTSSPLGSMKMDPSISLAQNVQPSFLMNISSWTTNEKLDFTMPKSEITYFPK